MWSVWPLSQQQWKTNIHSDLYVRKGVRIKVACFRQPHSWGNWILFSCFPCFLLINTIPILPFSTFLCLFSASSLLHPTLCCEKTQSPPLWRTRISCELCVIHWQGRMSALGSGWPRDALAVPFPTVCWGICPSVKQLTPKASSPTPAPSPKAGFAGLMSAISSVQSAGSKRLSGGQRVFSRGVGKAP